MAGAADDAAPAAMRRFHRLAAPSSGAVPWFDDSLRERRGEIAKAVLALLIDAERWRHRRVETLTPLSATFVRRRVSLDFTVPAERRDGLALGDGQWLLPLAWLRRRQLVNFDLRDAEGRALSVLLTTQTAEVTRAVLVLAAVHFGLPSDDPDVAEEAAQLARLAADARAPTEPAILERAAALGIGDGFEALVRASVDGFLLLAVVPTVAGRQVVKWQSDEIHRPDPFALFRRSLLRPDVPGINEAASTHIELELPDVLRATSFDLWDDLGPDGRPVRLPEGERAPAPSPERPRLLLHPVPAARRASVRATLAITPAEFLLPAIALATLALGILVLGLATDVGHHAGEQRGTAATILLAAFAALSGLVLRVEEHPLVRAALVRPRGALATVGIAVAVAAAPLALQQGSTLTTVLWAVAAAACALAWFVLAAVIITHTTWGQSAT
jgi:hypothetical protein